MPLLYMDVQGIKKNQSETDFFYNNFKMMIMAATSVWLRT